MAIEVNLEKNGHRKKGFLGFSWTTFFFNFFVYIFILFLINIYETASDKSTFRAAKVRTNLQTT